LGKRKGEKDGIDRLSPQHPRAETCAHPAVPFQFAIPGKTGEGEGKKMGRSTSRAAARATGTGRSTLLRRARQCAEGGKRRKEKGKKERIQEAPPTRSCAEGVQEKRRNRRHPRSAHHATATALRRRGKGKGGGRIDSERPLSRFRLNVIIEGRPGKKGKGETAAICALPCYS